MTELEAFFDAYVECAFWSSRVNNCIPEEDPTPLDEFFEPADLTDEARASLLADCRDFLISNRDLIGDLDMSQCGHDFWLSRNGHGTGFWDRGTGKQGDDLHAAAKVYGSVDFWITVDGKIATVL